MKKAKSKRPAKKINKIRTIASIKPKNKTKALKAFAVNAGKVKQRLVRLLSLYLIFGLTLTPITHCFYIDVESASGNNFEAASLNLSLRDNEETEITEALFDDELVYDEEAIQTVFVQKEGTLSFDYTITAEKTDGSDAACNALNVGIERDGVGGIYTGSLLGLNPTIDLSGAEDEVSFRIYLDDDDAALQDKKCEFKLKFDAEQQGVVGGFSAEASIITNVIQTGWWIDPTVKVNVPNGGEVWTLGSTHDIEWEAESTDPSATAGMKIEIKLSTDSGANYTTIASDLPNTGSYGWTVDTKSSTMRIQIIAEDSHGLSGHDESDMDFDPVEESEDDDDENEENMETTAPVEETPEELTENKEPDETTAEETPAEDTPDEV